MVTLLLILMMVCNLWILFYLTWEHKEAKLRQCVYISKEAHGIVSKIVNTIADKEITVGGYIDTVLMRHFEENKDEINNLYRRNRENLI